MRVVRQAVAAAAIAFGIFLARTPAAAHHAFAAEFDASQPMELHGTLTKIEWINPHSWVHVSVKRPNGQVENWEVEVGPPNSILRQGWTRDSLPPGLEVVVFGWRGKDPSKLRLNGQQILLSDGRRLFSGQADSAGAEIIQKGGGAKDK
jgi:Family of unknown function (DUF6152)